MAKGLNSSAPTTAEIVGGVYNVTPPTLIDGQATALQVDVNGKLITSGSGGGGGNVNITGVNGVAPALNNPLPVELSDGTNAFGTAANPLSENVAQWGGTAVAAAATTSPLGSEASPVTRSMLRRFQTILSVANPASGSTTYYPGATTSPTSANWVDTTLSGAMTVEIFLKIISTAAATLNLEQADDPNDTTSATNTNTLITSTQAPTSGAVQIVGQITKRYWRVKVIAGVNTITAFELGSLEFPVPLGVSINPASGGQTLDAGSISDGFSGVVNPFAPNWNGGGFIRTAPLASAQFVSTTGGNGTWSYQRTPNIFKTAQATAAGNTAVWTPTVGKKFRLMRFQVMLTAEAKQTTGGVLTITFQDNTTGINHAFDVFVPSTADTISGVDFNSSWIDLGNGILSAAANNILNVNLSAALTAGNVRVNTAGTEE